jgi:predicted DNA binding CopG/RHH family protein
MKIEEKNKTRKIHILLPEDLHRLVRIRCAYEDLSIQEYVSSLIAHDMHGYDAQAQSENSLTDTV